MKSIPVVYHPNMVATVKSFSPSAAKPAAVMKDWFLKDIAIHVLTARPCTYEMLYLAHDEDYVLDVLKLKRTNGFGTHDKDVAHSVRYTVGAMVQAASVALRNGKVACAPVSGFHHAGFDFGGGFCTFNGLMVAAAGMAGEGLKTSILDLDMHYGNGTQNIIELKGLHHMVSQYSDSHFDYQAEKFLANLSMLVEKLVDGADVLLYQAGADSHVDDPLGGYLTSDQMRRRDRIVFETCKRLGVPVAWNLAGGYQVDDEGNIDKVLALHRATMEECVATYVNA